MIIRNLALRLERRQDRRINDFRQRDHGIHALAGTVTGDDGRSPRLADALDDLLDDNFVRVNHLRTEAPFRARGPGTLIDGNVLHLVRKDQVCDISLHCRILQCQCHELCVPAVGQHCLAERRHRRKGVGQVDFLKGSRAKDLGIDLPGQGQQGSPVDPCVPQAGHEVGRSRTCDRHTGSRHTAELGIARAGKRGCPLVTNTDIGQVALLLLDTNGISETEIGVTDHAKDAPDAPVDHGLHHEVGNSPSLLPLFPHLHVDAVVTLLDGINRYAIVVGTRRLASQGMKVPAVPGTAKPALLFLLIALDRALTERPALMRAGIAEGSILAVVIHQCQSGTPGLNSSDLFLLHLAGTGNSVPDALHPPGGIEFLPGDFLVAAITERRIPCSLALAEEILAFLFSGPLHRSELRAGMRTVTQRLIPRPSAGTPVDGFSCFEFERNGRCGSDFCF